MPTYRYIALNKSGSKVSGEISAVDELTARRDIKAQGLFVTSMDVESERKWQWFNINLSSSVTNVSSKELIFFTRQLATLLKSGFALDAALNAISEQITKPSFHKIILDIDKSVKEGRTLCEALSDYPGLFKNIYTSLVRAGEASGQLENILFKLSEYQQAQMRLKNKVIATLMYPAIMLLVCVAVVGVLMVYVVPNITSVLLQQGQDLPMATAILIKSSHFIADWWIVLLIAVFFIFAGISRYYKTKVGRKQLDSFMLKLPLLGNLFVKVSISRFASTFAVLLRAGVDILRSLDIVKDVVGNVLLSTAIEESGKRLSQGDSLAQPLKESKVFPPIVIKMLDSGQKSGNLEVMLETIAGDYEDEVENTILGLTSILEPVIIVLMGGFVAFIVMAILIPMQGMMEGVH